MSGLTKFIKQRPIRQSFKKNKNKNYFYNAAETFVAFVFVSAYNRRMEFLWRDAVPKYTRGEL